MVMWCDGVVWLVGMLEVLNILLKLLIGCV